MVWLFKKLLIQKKDTNPGANRDFFMHYMNKNCHTRNQMAFFYHQVDLKQVAFVEKFTFKAYLFKQNKTQVVKTLEEYIINLSKFKTLLEKDGYEAVLMKVGSE